MARGPARARPPRGGGAIQRVCVVGGGVIGSLYAGHLARVADVSVLCRREEHARALNEQGLRVSGRHDFTAELRAATDAAKLPEAELAIIATKTTELDAAASRLAGHWPQAAVMTVQNGLGAEDIVRRHGDWSLVSAVTFMSGTRHADTHVEYILDTETWLGPYGGTPQELVDEIAASLVESGLKARAFEDLRPAQWSKLIFNSTVNSVAALTGLPHDPHFAERDRLEQLGHLVHDLMEEGKRVAAAAGIELHEDPWEMNVLATQRGSRHYPSMLEDVEAHRPTEVDQITGALVREAERLGIDVPLQTAMYRLVKAREASWASD
ncbi:MAG: ketopantoate reductase family protein [Gaiellaceae bacterium]